MALRGIWLVCAIVFAGLHQTAAAIYAPAANYTVGPFPCSPVVADVNSDGLRDIVCANYGSFSGGGNTLSVLTNIDNGQFALSSSPVVGLSPFSIAAGDINGDGKIDLVSANSDDGTVSILTNDGVGNFVLFTNLHLNEFSLNTYATSVVLVDSNGDGKMDLDIGLIYDAEVIILTNNGSGNFALEYDWFWGGLTITHPPELTSAADVNGDGQPDLISGSLWTCNVLSVSLSIPTLAITNTSSNTVVSWPSGWAGWQLLQSSDLATWTTNSNVFDDGIAVSCTLTSPPNHLFFRLAY